MKAREEKQTGLQAYSSIGHSLTLTTRLIGNIVDEVQLMSSGYKHCIERIHQPPQFREGGEEFSYHFCYYAPSENGRRVFGQHGRLFPQRELRELLRPCPREWLADLSMMPSAPRSHQSRQESNRAAPRCKIRVRSSQNSRPKPICRTYLAEKPENAADEYPAL